jgi:hypothetical protein
MLSIITVSLLNMIFKFESEWPGASGAEPYYTNRAVERNT